MIHNIKNKILQQGAMIRLKESMQSDLCYYGNCSDKPILSHSIQKALLRATIGSSGTVYTLTPSDVARNISQGEINCFEKHSLNDAGVFTGFCGDNGKAHDTKLFTGLENMTLLHQISIEKYVFLYAYRSLVYQLWLETSLQSKSHSKSSDFLSKNSKIANKDIEIFNQLMSQIEGLVAESTYNLDMYREMQSYFEKYLNEDGDIANNFSDDFLIHFELCESFKSLEFLGVGAKKFLGNYPVVYGLLPQNGNKPSVFFVVAHRFDIDDFIIFKKFLCINKYHTIENMIALSGNLMMSEFLYEKLKSTGELKKLEDFINPQIGVAYSSDNIIKSQGFSLF